jgi:hypothetical protein
MTGSKVVTPANHVRENAMDRSVGRLHRWFVALGFAVAAVIGVAPARAQEFCGGVSYPFPYTDVSTFGAAFCPGIMEAYVTGVSKGTAPTTFSPTETVTRVQMTTFLQRSLDQGLTRTNRRAALRRWWTPQNPNAMQTIATPYGGQRACDADGADIWVATGPAVVQVQANIGKVLGTWTASADATAVLAVAGKVFVGGATGPGSLYEIDPTQSPGAVTVVANTLGGPPNDIAFDGNFLWTSNGGGSVSGIDPTSPYAVYNVSTGFTSPSGILFDGASIWITDAGAGMLFKLDLGSIVQSVPVGKSPLNPVFDGANIWVPNYTDNSITVVQASTGSVVATITSDANNLLSGPNGASFDGERVMVTNANGGNSSVTLFKAADLSFIANVSVGSSGSGNGACSDGINIWVLTNQNMLRF